MIKTFIEMTPHVDQRYNTCGDWFWLCPDILYIRVSKLGNWKMEHLVAIHEYVEALLCRARGIEEKIVSEFDKQHLDSEEPGALPEAPYHKEHMFATYLECKLAEQLGVGWDEYEKAINELPDIPCSDTDLYI